MYRLGLRVQGQGPRGVGDGILGKRTSVDGEKASGGRDLTRWLVARAQSGARIELTIKERPLLYVCTADDGFVGDVRVDARRTWATTVQASMEALPFKADSFAAAYFDPPWAGMYRARAAKAMLELRRIAPVIYTLGPWLWGTSQMTISDVRVCYRPGFNLPLLFARYERKEAET